MSLLMFNICYAICGFIFAIFLLVIMIYKIGGNRSLDEKIFIYQVLTTFLFGLAYIAFIVSCIYFPSKVTLINFFTKSYVYTLILHESFIVTTAIAIVLKNNESLYKKFVQKKYLFAYYSLTTLFPLILVLFTKTGYRFYDDGIYHIYGPTMKLVFIYTFVSTGIEFLILIINRKSIKGFNVIPLAILMGSYVLFVHNDSSLNQNFDAALMFFVAIDFVFYMTIESKDLMLIEDYNMKKKILDEKNNATSKYMLSISDKIRIPLCTIMGNSRYLKDNKDLDNNDVQNMVNDINNSCDILYSNVMNSEGENNDR